MMVFGVGQVQSRPHWFDPEGPREVGPTRLVPRGWTVRRSFPLVPRGVHGELVPVGEDVDAPRVERDRGPRQVEVPPEWQGVALPLVHENRQRLELEVIPVPAYEVPVLVVDVLWLHTSPGRPVGMHSTIQVRPGVSTTGGDAACGQRQVPRDVGTQTYERLTPTVGVGWTPSRRDVHFGPRSDPPTPPCSHRGSNPHSPSWGRGPWSVCVLAPT